jgi:hypothetical protein
VEGWARTTYEIQMDDSLARERYREKRAPETGWANANDSSGPEPIHSKHSGKDTREQPASAARRTSLCTVARLSSAMFVERICATAIRVAAVTRGVTLATTDAILGSAAHSPPEVLVKQHSASR